MEMSYKNFTSRVLDNLVDYCKRKCGNDKLGGIYQGNVYDHILKIEGFNKLGVVKDYNLLCGVKADPFLIENKLHSYVHHLNSSQIMCYNFFRPLIKDKSTPKDVLIKILKKYCTGLNPSKDSKCEFEYVEEYGDGTNFDFYIENGDISVFCEIKYTEKTFTKKSRCKNPKERYEKAYKPIIMAQKLWTDDVSEDAVMNEYYQLFHNASKAKKDKSYVLFICPKDNCSLKKQYDDFRRKFMKENDVVQYVFWEDLVDAASKMGEDMSEFETKYFGYKQ